MNSKVSIIIPVYNVEKYVKEAVESAMNQTYKNIEIILVDDGSTDNSGKICDEIEKEDKRIKVIHTKNGGLSAARNVGLETATGDYIMFLDSDDFLELDAVEHMYNAIEEKNADYIIGNYINATEDGEKWEKPVFSYEEFREFRLSIEDSFNSFFIMNSSVCNKIFRKTFIEELNLKFEEGLPAEDAIFTTYCFIKSQRVFYIPKLVFNYRQRKGGSISTSCSTEYFEGINKAYRIIYENFRDNERLEYYRYFYGKSMNYIIYKFIDSYLLTNKQRSEILDNMMWFYNLTLELEVPPSQKCIEKVIRSVLNKDFDRAIDYCEVIRELRTYMTSQERERMSKPAREKYKEISKLDSKYRKISKS